MTKRFLRIIFAVLLTASAPPMVLQAQSTDYNSVVAQAKADLSAGRNAEALADTQKAIGIDPSRWEAYLIAGSALENQKQFDVAIDNYTKALNRAPEPKKTGVRDILEQCEEIAAKTGYDVNAAKKRQEAVSQFKEMKTHFENGVHAIADADATKQQLRTSSADQKATLQAQLNTDYQTAVTEFDQAQQSAPEEDPNLPTILGNLGIAYDGAGKYPEAVDTLQKAVALKPTPALYMQLGTDLTKVGKIPEAGAACDKAATLDPTSKTVGESCYKNMGVVLVNSGKMKDAIEPLQKATALNPNDADAWYMLGNALGAGIYTKREGNKQVYVVPPGTEEAYKKYLELQPNGADAAEAKTRLGILIQLSTASTP